MTRPALRSCVLPGLVLSPTPSPTPTPTVPDTGAITGRKTYAKPTVAKFGFRTAKLALGRHKLQVRAVLHGTVDPTPSVKKFRVTARD